LEGEHVSSLFENATYFEIATSRLDRLWHAVYGRACPPAARARFETMMLPWGAARIPSRPSWPSDIGDDHSPYEFSIAFAPNEAPVVRFLVEAQGSEPTLASTRDAALDLTHRLAEHGVDLARFERVRELFLPPVPDARFALWHAARLSGKPEVKAYFNPQIAGKERSFELVEWAMRALGFESAWPSLVEAAQRRTVDDEIRYFALDLAGGEAARVKVYLYQRGVTAEHLERMAALRPGYMSGDLTEFCRAMTGTTGPYDAFPLCTYLSFVEGDPIPTEVAVQIPVRFYVDNDATARTRIMDYMRARGVSADLYDKALTALAPRELGKAAGLNTYVSLRAGTSRLTVYIATELFSTPLHAKASSMVSSVPPRRSSYPAPRQSSQPDAGKMP
jgi:DMATS type aromatic prenyltransferase